MELDKLEKILNPPGAREPRYRLKQAKEAVFKNFISDWNEATFFTKELRERLNKECPLLIKADVLVAGDKSSIKARITLKDPPRVDERTRVEVGGLKVETALMRHEDPLRSEASGRNTVCVSCQVGCPLGCLFCATGKMGFKRNLTVNEILEQVIFFERWLSKKIVPSKSEGSSSRVTNVTFMGMGEPFLNYDNVLAAIKILNSKEYFNIGIRSISVSTAGIVEGIEKFGNEGLGANLAISLHAPNDKLRKSLMPIDKKYPLEEVLKAVDEYIKKTKRKVMFEYVLIKGVNDSDECAKELAKLMAKKLYFVNLILYNPTGSFMPSDAKRVERFKQILKSSKINFVQRYRFGDDIKAACGQFATSK